MKFVRRNIAVFSNVGRRDGRRYDAMKWLILCFVVSIVSGCGNKSRGELPTAKAEVGDLHQTVAISGTVKAKRESFLPAPYAGYVRKLFVEVGSQVQKGDPLITITANLSPEEVGFPMRAAFDGMVSQVLRSEGDYVTNSGQEARLLKIEDRSQMQIESDVPEADFTKVKLGQRARIRVNAIQGVEFDGEIVQIFQAAREADNSWDRKGGSFPIRIQLKNPTPEVVSGLSSVVEIRVASREKVLRLPQEFVLREQGRFAVIKKKSNARVEVKTGLRTESFIEIIEGLSAGDEVVFPLAKDAGESN
jgi:multidrug efflux pump subunit AcrA (membrane-fusion protein)